MTNKQINWITNSNEIIFNLNWIEYIFLKRVFLKKKYQIIDYSSKPIKGESIVSLYVDDWGVKK